MNSPSDAKLRCRDSSLFNQNDLRLRFVMKPDADWNHMFRFELNDLILL